MSNQNKMTETNWYTIAFALVMSLVVAGGLAGLKSVWGEKQIANELLFSKRQILSSVMEDLPADIDSVFKEKVTGKLLNSEGEVISEDINELLSLNLWKEGKLPAESRKFPVYEYKEDDGKVNYILPTVGLGLWDQIMSFIALEEDKNTIAGISFDHKAETPGLGAKIKDDPGFYKDFIGEKIMNEQGEIVGVTVKKGNGDPANTDKTDHEIDAISGATITGDGVTYMLRKDLELYEPFIKDKN